jgi:hypothetical protein
MAQQLLERTLRGRPSRHPSRVAYHESPEVVDALRSAAADHALGFAEMQRLVNRAGLKALRLEAVT